MKKICFLFLLVSILLVAYNVTASEIFYETFDNQASIYKWQSVPRDGEIKVTTQGELQISIPYEAQLSADAYLQSKLFDGSKKFSVSFDISYNTGQGNAQVGMRDSSSVLNGHFISIAKVTADKIYYLPEILNDTVYETMVIGTVCRIEVIFDPIADTIKIYNAGVQKAQVNNFKSVKSGYWKDFMWNQFVLRLQASRGGTVASASTFDNVIFNYFSYEMESMLFGNPEIAYDTDESEKAFMICRNNGTTDKNVTVITAVYNGTNLLKTNVGNTLVVKPGQVAKPSAEVSLSTLLNGETLKIMVFENLATQIPLKDAFEYKKQNPIYSSIYSPTPLELSLNFKKKHPRLISEQDTFNRLKTNISSGSGTVYTWYSKILARANTYLTSPIPTYEDADPNRLTGSINILNNIMDMAFTYKVTGDIRYANRIYLYLQNSAAWPDWGEQHFLNTADMCMAYGIAYDWLYDYWSEEEKNFIAKTLMDKGLMIAYRDYMMGAGWTKLDSNWTAVCNAGVAVGATSIMDRYTICSEILSISMKNVQRCYPHFAPDGGWFEGTVYWAYAMDYWSYMMSTVETAFGTEFGHKFTSGLKNSAYFPIYTTGNTTIFNLNDDSELLPSTACMFYLGKLYEDKFASGFRYYQLTGTNRSPSTVDLLWYDKNNVSLNFKTELNNNQYYSNMQTVIMRNGFAEKTESAVMLHGGENNISHGQLDTGNFLYEAGGVRWAVDLGGDSYNLYGYANMSGAKNRWCYYRNRAEGHNTWVLNPSSGADQHSDGYGLIDKTNFTSGTSFAIANLTPSYRGVSPWVKRGIKYNKTDGRTVIRDEIILRSAGEAYWFMHTAADISLSSDKKTAILTQKNKSGITKRLLVEIADGTGTFEVKNATPLATSPNPNTWIENMNNVGDVTNPRTQNSNIGIKKLCIRYQNVTNINQTVGMVLLDDQQTAPLGSFDTTSLGSW